MTLDTKQQYAMDCLLIEAVSKRDLLHIQTYVGKGANVNVYAKAWETTPAGSTSGDSPLFHLMYESYFSKDVANYFLSQGVSVDVQNFNGNTALMLAVKNGDLDRVQYLLDKGADPLSVNTAGDLVLDEARKLGTNRADRQKIIDALVDKMASIAPAGSAPAEKTEDKEVETGQQIQTLKPIALKPKKGNSFSL